MIKNRKGFVYILTNPAMPGLLKVGMTARVPELRILDNDMTSTGVPGNFEVEYYSFFNDMILAEKKAHQKLKQYHYGKEFFKTDVFTAITAIESIDLEFTRLFSVKIPVRVSLGWNLGWNSDAERILKEQAKYDAERKREAEQKEAIKRPIPLYLRKKQIGG